jgi:hypothetical protein
MEVPFNTATGCPGQDEPPAKIGDFFSTPGGYLVYRTDARKFFSRARSQVSQILMGRIFYDRVSSATTVCLSRSTSPLNQKLLANRCSVGLVEFFYSHKVCVGLSIRSQLPRPLYRAGVVNEWTIGRYVRRRVIGELLGDGQMASQATALQAVVVHLLYH